MRGTGAVDIVDGQAHIEQLRVRPDQLGKGLSAIVVDEARQGLDPAQRVCRRLDLPG
jgi:hypothetical protein